MTKDGLLQIEGWARRGLTNEQIARNIGVSQKTFYVWLNKYGEIGEALKKGRAPLNIELENALIKKALGYTDVESVTTEIKKVEGTTEERVKTVKRTYPPDTGAAIFLLKNRLADYYQDKPKTEQDRLAVDLENEIRRLKIQVLQNNLDDANPEISKLDELLSRIDQETKEAEEDVVDGETE